MSRTIWDGYLILFTIIPVWHWSIATYPEQMQDDDYVVKAGDDDWAIITSVQNNNQWKSGYKFK